MIMMTICHSSNRKRTMDWVFFLQFFRQGLLDKFFVRVILEDHPISMTIYHSRNRNSCADRAFGCLRNFLRNYFVCLLRHYFGISVVEKLRRKFLRSLSWLQLIAPISLRRVAIRC